MFAGWENYASLHNHNLLLVCKGIGKDGIPVYEDQSANMASIFQASAHRLLFLIMIWTVTLICIC